MHNYDSNKLVLLQQMLPEGCGVLLYYRAGAPPWELRTVLGDALGVVGVPLPALRQVWPELVHPQDEPRVKEALVRLGMGESVTLDYRLRTATGGERWVHDSLRRLPSAEAGGVFIGMLRDASVERTLRDQTLALEERIWRAQRVDSLGELAAGIAHDLGNLLTAILSSIQLAEGEPELPERAREDLAVARESARRGSGFVRQILRFASRQEHAPGVVDINTVIQDLRLILARSLGTDIRLVIQADPGLPAIHCDPGQLEQVLLNLAVNAREATTGGGQLTISTERVFVPQHLATEGATLPPGLYVLLSVADTGRGIPAHVRARIFEPFFSTKTRQGSGSGFGLSTVHRIVRGHGGGIRVDTEEGRGTRFEIYLPIRPSTPAVVEAPAPAPQEESRAHILLVEHDRSVREVMQRVLGRESLSVVAVSTAREALEQFERTRTPFNALLTDVALPDRSGTDLARLLRSRAPGLPVIFVSGWPTQTSPALEVPDALFVEKPFTSAQLTEAVERALQGQTGETARKASGD